VHTLRHTFKTLVDTGENLDRAAADGASETEHNGVIQETFAHGPREGCGEAGLRVTGPAGGLSPCPRPGNPE